MITFICFVLFELGAPWWVYLLAIIGVLCECSEMMFIMSGRRRVGQTLWIKSPIEDIRSILAKEHLKSKYVETKVNKYNSLIYKTMPKINKKLIERSHL